MRFLIVAAVLAFELLLACGERSNPGEGGSSAPGSGSGAFPSAGAGDAGAPVSGGRAGGSAAPSGGAPSASGGAGNGASWRGGSGGGAVMTTHGGSGAATGSVTTGGGAGAGGAAQPIGGAAGSGSADPSAEIYDPERVPRFDIELSSESLAALGRDPDTYVRGALRYETETVRDIGVRIKGEGSLRPLTKKAALKLKFDEFVDDQSFKGLRRMTLNNMVEDPSFLAERLAYQLFRVLGLPAPRCNSAVVYVNGEPYGVYANVEAEDKTFLRRWFASDAGNLYEEGQEDFVPGAEQIFDLETNETTNDRSDLAALIALVESATPDDFLEHVGQKLDMGHFLRFTAAEAAVNQWDMYGYTVFYPNNFRLYHDPTTRLFVFLPWGMDMSMKPFRDSGKRFISIFSLARQGDRANAPVTAGLLFRKCLASAACKEALSSVFGQVATAYEDAGLEALANRYYEQIKPHVLVDPRREYTNDQFERGYQSLLSTIRDRPAAIRAEL